MDSTPNRGVWQGGQPGPWYTPPAYPGYGSPYGTAPPGPPPPPNPWQHAAGYSGPPGVTGDNSFSHYGSYVNKYFLSKFNLF